MRVFFERLLNSLRIRRPENDLAREIDAHLALMQEAYEARGMDPGAARRAARLGLGGVEQTKELHREARSFTWIEDVRQDVAHGLRLLRRSPLFTFTAAMSLAIGIGVNTAIFTVANSLLFRPPSGIADSHELIDIGAARGDGGLNPLPYATYLEVARRSTLLSGVFAQDMFPHVMSLVPPDTGAAERVLGQSVTTNFFAVLGSPAVRGRIFAAGDDAVAVLDYGYWIRRFHGDDAVVGQALRINGRMVTVVGVAAAGFQGTGIQIRDIWLAIGPNGHPSTVIAGARVRGDISSETAAAEVATIGDALSQEQHAGADATRLSALPLSPAGGNRNVVFGFTGVLIVLVSIVLAVACANVAGIILARSTARAREIAIRTALGAWRGRLIRQLLTETFVLYFLGGLLGGVLARTLIGLTALLPALPFPISVPLVLDGRVLMFALLLSLSAAGASGILPAFKASKADPGTVMKEGARSSPARSRLRSAFVVGQVALSILLVVLGALFVRVLQYAGASDPGFDSRNVEIATIDLTMTSDTQTEKDAFWSRLIERVRQLPAVEAASLARVPPGGFEGIGLGGVGAGEAPAGSDLLSPGWNVIDAGYFAALRIPLVGGRDFTDADRAGAPPVVIVSQAIAQRLWPGQNAVGKPLALSIFNAQTRRMERRAADVVGVASDIRSSSLVDGLAEPYVYLPRAQSAETGMTTVMSIVARARGPNRLELALVAIVRDLDPSLVIANTQPLANAVALGLAPQRVLVAVAATMGFVGLLLASMGIYGVTAYSVAVRRREFGIRLALGASPVRVIWMVLRGGVVLVAIGAVIGLTLAAGAGRILSVFFYGLPSIHVPTLFGTVALFIVVGAAACAVPAGQAVRVDWQRALHEE
jgi:putative ABC transport system permease protein